MHTVTTYRAYSGSFSVRLHITVNIIMCFLWNILFLRIIAFVTVISFLSLCLTGCRCIILYFFVVCAFYCYIFSCNNFVTRFCSYRNCSVFIAVTTPSSVTVAILVSDDEKLSIPSAQRLRTALFL